MISVLFSLIFACADDVTKDKPTAAVADAPATQPPPAATAATTDPAATPLGDPAAPPMAPGAEQPAAGPELAFDAAKSRVAVHAAKVTRGHDLTFSNFTGGYTLTGDTVSGLRVVVKTDSVSTDPEKLTQHLKSPDFLDVATMPEATFSGTITAGDSGGKGTHTVKGKLSLHGVEKEITFPATLGVTPAEISGHAEFSVDRHDFGIAYPGKPDDLIQDGVLFDITLVSKR